SELERKFAHLFYEGRRRREAGLRDVVAGFLKTTGEIEDQLGSVLALFAMSPADLTTFLHLCATGAEHPLHAPPPGADLDVVVAEDMHGEESGNVHLHPVQMTNDALEAAAEAASGDVIYGYYTMTVTVFSEDETTVNEYAKRIQKTVRNRGFGARIEEANALE